MVRLIIRKVSEKKGVGNPYALSRLTGINYANVYKMWHGRQTMISVDTIDTLCKALRVSPGELFEFVEKRRQAGGAKAPRGRRSSR